MNPGAKSCQVPGFSPDRYRSGLLVGLGKVGFVQMGFVLASFMSIDTARVIREEVTSDEKMSPPDYPVGHFLY